MIKALGGEGSRWLLEVKTGGGTQHPKHPVLPYGHLL